MTRPRAGSPPKGLNSRGKGHLIQPPVLGGNFPKQRPFSTHKRGPGKSLGCMCSVSGISWLTEPQVNPHRSLSLNVLICKTGALTVLTSQGC